jgi:signal transduction histidine kinase
MTACYGGLFGIILALGGLLTYTLHVRSLYDDVDRALVTSASRSAAEADASPDGPNLVEGHGGFEVILALYGSEGVLRRSSAGTDALPPVDPRAILRAPAGPSYDGLASIPPAVSPRAERDAGAFGTLNTPAQRWRLYIVPVIKGQAVTEYIGALTPLGQVDAAVQTFRVTLFALVVGGLATALAGSWAISGRTLRPIAHIVRNAQAIAASRDLSRRVDVPAQRDELGELAETLNEMLGSLEGAYRAQLRFVADASHELRAPLTSIQANLDLLMRQREMPQAEREEALTEARREVGRLTRLVADLLVLARADAGVAIRHAPVELDEIVLDAFRSARQLADGQHLALDPIEPLSVVGDEDRLRQLLLILLDNAIKYTPPGGSVRVGLRRLAGAAEVVVCDSGVGIAPSDLPHVFERFYRADPARGRDPGGTGLGLAIARWIADQHEAQLSLESRPGQGTAATLRLPLNR